MRTTQLFLTIFFLLLLFSHSLPTTDTLTEKSEEIIDSVKEGLHKGKNRVEEKIVEAGDYIKEAYTKTKHRAENVVEGIKETGHNIKEMAGEKIEDIKEKIDELTHRAKHKAEDIRDSAGSAYENVKDSAGSTFENVRDSASDLLGKAKRKGEDIKDVVNEKFDSARETIGDMKDKAGERIEGAKRVTEGVKNMAKDRYEGAKSTYEEVARDVKDKSKGAFENIKEKIGDAVEGVKETLFHGKVKEDVKDVGENVRRSYEDIKDKAGDKVEDIKDRSKSYYENIKDKVGDTIEGMRDTITNTAQNLKDKVMGMKDKAYDTATGLGNEYDLRDSVVDTKYRPTKKSILPQDIGNAYEGAKDVIKDNVGDVIEKGKEKAKDVYKEAKRTWEGVSSKLEPLYAKGWEKLELIFKHGEFNMDELKDLLGSKFEEFNEIFNQDFSKPGRDMDRDKGVVGRPKGSLREERLPDKLRELYDLMWNKIDEVFKTGNINFDDLSMVFHEKTDDLKEFFNKATSDKDNRAFVDQEIKRIKGLISNWGDKLCENCEHKKGLWENILSVFREWGNKASHRWHDIKDRVVSGSHKEEPPQPTMDKSSEL